MHTADMLSAVIKFNREMMQTAMTRMNETVDDQDSREWQTAYQIYRDSEAAFENAKRAIKYGMPGVE